MQTNRLTSGLITKIAAGFIYRKNLLLIFTLLVYPFMAANRCMKVSGDYRAGVTPLPISNREVKLRIADGTTTAGLWESRSSPDLYLNLS